jgi:YcxB-like protein
MTIHFGYDKKKVIQALRYHFISRPEIRLMIILVNVLAVLLFIAFALKYLKPAHYLTFSLLWFVLMLSFWFLFPYSTYGKTAMFKNEYSMAFSDSDFSLIHERGQKAWPWSSIKSYLESPHFFHLYFDAKTFLLVPKDACKNSDEVHQLRQLIQVNVKKGTIRG